MNPNANIDYCGIIMLLRELKKNGIYNETEIKRIAARIRTELGATVIIEI